MILGALIDAGAPADRLKESLGRLGLSGFALDIYATNKNGFRATKVDVQVSDQKTSRRLPEIDALVSESVLPEQIKTRALAVMQKIGEVEAHIHGIPLEQVHLHELGGLDTIVDVVGTLLCLEFLEVSAVISSPLPLGRGFIQGAHGQIPLPAPATLALLEGIPVYGVDLNTELVTPTGAALLRTLAAEFGPIPAMNLLATGYGAGGRDLPIPNILRVLIGERHQHTRQRLESLVMLETNIDDLNPEVYEYVMERLFQGGALDVTLTAIQMKKNRPGTQISVLAPPTMAEELSAILFQETSTLGIRRRYIERLSLPRRIYTVTTPYGEVHVKAAYLDGARIKFAPEYEDCRRLARHTGVSLVTIYRAAEQAAAKLLSSP